MTRQDWAIFLPIFGACCIAVWLSGCAFSITGNATIDMSPNLQVLTTRSDQASGEGNEVWSEPTGGANIGTDAIDAVSPVIVP